MSGPEAGNVGATTGLCPDGTPVPSALTLRRQFP